MEAPQTTALQRQWAQYVTSRNCLDTEKTLSMNISFELFLQLQYFVDGEYQLIPNVKRYNTINTAVNVNKC